MDALTVIGVVASLVFGGGGLVVGVVGLVGANRANALARQANEIAEAANAAADRSVAQVEASNARALESHVVEWAMGWDSGHLFWVRNDGRDTARSAFIRVTIDGEVEEMNQELDVPPRQNVRLQFEKVREAWRAEEQARADHQFVEQRPGVTIMRGVYKPPIHQVRLQIWWRTDLDSPRAFGRAFSGPFTVTEP